MIILNNHVYYEAIGRLHDLAEYAPNLEYEKELQNVIKLLNNSTNTDFDTCFVDLCWDFDGCIHRYDSGWQGVTTIPDPIVDGAIEALYSYLEADMSVAIYSARSAQTGGIDAMKEYIKKHDKEYCKTANPPVPAIIGSPLIESEMLKFPYAKPAAKVYIDDRGMRFEGKFPTPQELKELYTPWHKGKV